MNLGGGAFGIMCSFMVFPLQAVAMPAAQMVGMVSEVTRSVADGLSELADGFEETERGVADGFNRLSQGLGLS